MEFSKTTLFALFICLFPATLLSQGHWTGSNNTTTPISRTGTAVIGSTTYNHNSATAHTQLRSNAGIVSYGPITAIRAGSEISGGVASAGASSAHSFKWSAHSGVQGATGSAKVASIYTYFANKDALGLGGDFTVNIDNPVAYAASPGGYYIGGVRARLQGNITTYPNVGVVSAVMGFDEIQGARTYAAYFDGRAYFSGNVGIGVANPVNALEVCGTIRATEVKVESGWCDYVFEEDYERMSLAEVDAFIEANGHLPKTPSALEIQQNGLELAKATENQQEKIEEIFLHLIEMEQKIEMLEAENEQLRNVIGQDKGGK